MENMKMLFLALAMVFVLYILVLVMIIIDLIYGVKKAKERGELRTSTGYKRTVDKLTRYYTSLICLTVMDAVQMMFVWTFNSYYGYNIPLAPIITGVGAIGLCAIEWKSIKEKADEKSRKDTEDVIKLIAEVIKNSNNYNGIADAIVDYMRGGNNEGEQQDGGVSKGV